MVPPTLPGHRHILQTLPANRDLAPTSQALTHSRCGDAQCSPGTPGAGALVSLPRSHERAGAETGTELRGSHKHLHAALCADNSSSPKDSGCYKPDSKESSVLWHLGILSPLSSTGQKHTHSSKGSTPSHSIQPELLGLLGTCFCLNIYIYIYIRMYEYV